MVHLSQSVSELPEVPSGFLPRFHPCLLLLFASVSTYIYTYADGIIRLLSVRVLLSFAASPVCVGSNQHTFFWSTILNVCIGFCSLDKWLVSFSQRHLGTCWHANSQPSAPTPVLLASEILRMESRKLGLNEPSRMAAS